MKNNLTQAQIAADIRQIIEDYAAISPEKITLDANFATDLNLDSLDQVEIVMAVEDFYNITIDDEDTNINTLTEAVSTVTKYL